MAENDIMSSLPEALSRIMDSPEIKEVFASLKKGTEDGTAAVEEPSAPLPQSSSAASVPPEIMAKLPQIISAVSKMGSVSDNGRTASTSPSQPKQASDKKRKALLASLRPYLNPHRQNVLDNMLRLEGITSLMSTVSAETAKSNEKGGTD